MPLPAPTDFSQQGLALCLPYLPQQNHHRRHETIDMTMMVNMSTAWTLRFVDARRRARAGIAGEVVNDRLMARAARRRDEGNKAMRCRKISAGTAAGRRAWTCWPGAADFNVPG